MLLLNTTGKRVLGSFMLLIFIASCSGNNKKSDEKELLSFSFQEEFNPGVLTGDYPANITGDTIKISLAEGTDVTALAASFTFKGKYVSVKDHLQQSGVTKNDFTEPVSYSIEAEDGSTTRYITEIEFTEDVSFGLRSFSFLAEDNPLLSEDIPAGITGYTVSSTFTAPLVTLIPRFEAENAEVFIGEEPQISGETAADFSKPVTYTLVSEHGATKDYTVEADWQLTLPHFIINTENRAPVNQKETYISAEIEINGAGIYENFSATTGIRGRGNSTWGRTKKPYKLKLDKKAEILGLGKAKKWVLLANDFDETLMLNSAAMEIGHLIDFPYTNHMIPVDLTLNGEFLGSYVLTEQVEVKENRVDTGDESLLLELDVYYNKDWKFRTENYDLPVLVKFPKLKDYPQQEAEHALTGIKTEFDELVDSVYSEHFPDNGYGDLFDKASYADYLIVYLLSANKELNHPKSTYLYRPEGEKFKMGPLWDFDWGFSFNGVDEHFIVPDERFFQTGSGMLGTVFFEHLLVNDPETVQLLKDRWIDFRNNKLDALLNFVDDYAALIEESQQLNYKRWQRGSTDLQADTQKLKTWLINRAAYLDGYIGGL